MPKLDFAYEINQTMKTLTNPKHRMQDHGDGWQTIMDGRAGCICGAEEMSLDRFNIACAAVASVGRQLHNRQPSSTRRWGVRGVRVLQRPHAIQSSWKRAILLFKFNPYNIYKARRRFKNGFWIFNRLPNGLALVVMAESQLPRTG